MTFGTGLLFGLICGVMLVGIAITVVVIVDTLIDKIRECIDE